MNKLIYAETYLIENETTLYYVFDNKIFPVKFLYIDGGKNNKKIYFELKGVKKFCSLNSQYLYFSEEDARNCLNNYVNIDNIITKLDRNLIFECDKIPPNKVEFKNNDYYEEEKEHLLQTCSFLKELTTNEKNKLELNKENICKYNNEISKSFIEDVECGGFNCFNSHYINAKIILDEIKSIKAETDRNLEKINKIYKNAYFGRIDFLLDNQEYTIYIGETELENKIYQWQDGLIGEIYYKTEKFLNYFNFKITLRRAIKVKNDNLIEVLNSDLLSFEMNSNSRKRLINRAKSFTINDPLNTSLADQTFNELIEEIRKEKTVHSIASSMKTIQYNIASYDVNKNIIVEGCPGSGKTMIMFERLSYIDYFYKHKINKVYLVTPNEVFGNLYNDLARKHNLENLSYLTYSKFLKLNSFDLCQRNKIFPFIDIGYLESIKPLSLSYIDDCIFFDEFLNLYEKIDVHDLNFANWLANYIYFYLDCVGVKNVKKEDLFVSNKLSNDKLKIIIDKMNRKVKIEELFLTYSYENFLHTAKDDAYAKQVVIKYKEVITFLSSKITKYKNRGVEKVSYIKELILNKTFEKIIQVLLANKVITTFNNVLRKKENVESIFILKCYFALYKVKKENNLLGNHYLFEIEYILRLMSLKFGPITSSSVYLFIDEYQNYTKFQIETLRLLFPNSIMNLFGDIKQRFNVNGIKRKKDLANITDFDCFEINQNVRNAKDITEYVNNLLGTKMVPINVKGKVKETTKDDVVFKKQGRTAIICKRINEIRVNLECDLSNKYNFVEQTNNIDMKIINVIDIDLVKGLEFDTVYVFLDDLTYEEKYVALTRALHNLYVIKNNKEYN